MTYRPSRLELLPKGRTVQLRFVPPAYELVLRDEEEKIFVRGSISGAQLRQVTLDMRQVESGSIRLSYAARHILMEIDGKLFARVADVDFMKLHDVASMGAGEDVNAQDSFGFR